MPPEVTSTAVEVLRARGTTPPKLVIDRVIDLSLDSAYAVQWELTKLRLERGETQIGYKVGCTSQSIQAQMGIHKPIFGRLFERDELNSPQSINRAAFDGLAVEGEIAVALDRDPRELPKSRVGVEHSISCVFPVIELHHFGIPVDALNASVLVANNAIHAGFVQPQKRGTAFTAEVERLSIRFNGNEVAAVPFNEFKNTVLDSLTWLRDELISGDDTPRLTPPVTVLCGSVARLFRITDATTIDVAYGRQKIRCDVQ